MPADDAPGDLTFSVEESIEIVRDFSAFHTTFPRFGTFAVTGGFDTVRMRRDGGDVLTRFGFDQGGGAGVRFTDLVVIEVQDEGRPLITNRSRTFTLNGEFPLEFLRNRPRLRTSGCIFLRAERIL